MLGDAVVMARGIDYRGSSNAVNGPLLGPMVKVLEVLPGLAFTLLEELEGLQLVVLPIDVPSAVLNVFLQHLLAIIPKFDDLTHLLFLVGCREALCQADWAFLEVFVNDFNQGSR
jgi:hypothetical protein